MATCYIAIGSNLGDRRGFIESAIKKMRLLANTKVNTVSSIIETLPQGGPPQALYLNCVLAIETDLTPYHLLQELQKIESILGRVRSVLNAPRTIDLDILTYGDICMEEEALCIPHPRMLERDFVMIPLKEIASDLAGKLQSKARKAKQSRLKVRGRRKVIKRTKLIKRK